MRLDAAARKTFPVLVCVLLNVGAYLQVKGFNALVGTALSDGAVTTSEPSSLSGHARTKGPRDEGEHVSDARSLLDRNVFDSSFGRTPHLSQAATAIDPPCAGVHASLIAFGDDPTWSFASLAARGAPQMLRRIGDELEGRTVLAIQRDRVVLGAGDLVCEVKLGAPRTPNPSVAAAAAPSKLLDGAVERVGVDHLVVQRAAIAALLGDPHAALGRVRVVPAKGGLAVRGVAPGSPLAALGLENGDVLQSLGGASLTDPSAAVRALASLSSATSMDVVLVRAGATRTVHLDIRD
ncbi:MAG TPA: type II secretion system protein GspC [Byssovorax sp.]|jgi:type II secretory pathway component PulC